MAVVSRRHWVVGGVAAVGGGLAAACAGGGGQSADAPAARKEPVTLEFEHRWDGPARVPLVEKQIQRFQSLHEHITVNVTMNLTRGDGTYGGVPVARLLAQIAAGTPPAVFMISSEAAVEFAQRNAVTFVDPFLKREKVNMADVWFPSVFPMIQLAGKTFALSQDAAGDFPYIFYNRNLVQAAGVNPTQFGTWDGLVEASRALTKPFAEGFAQIGFPFPGGNFTDWHTVNGGELLTKDARKVAFDGPAGRETLTYMTEAAKRVYGTPQRLADFTAQFKATTMQGRSETEAGWNAQKVAVMASGPWLWVETPSYAPQLVMGAARMPVNKANARSKQTTLAESVWTWAMGGNLKRPDEAWLLEKWLSYEDGHRELMIDMGRATMVKRVIRDKAYSDKNPGWSLVLETIEAATPLPQSKGWAAAKPLINAAAAEVLAGTAGVDAALSQAAQKAQLELDRALA
jgi:ABC-type glycerol-3-phosphate transport system substrate-binding protein